MGRHVLAQRFGGFCACNTCTSPQKPKQTTGGGFLGSCDGLLQLRNIMPLLEPRRRAKFGAADVFAVLLMCVAHTRALWIAHASGAGVIGGTVAALLSP